MFVAQNRLTEENKRQAFYPIALCLIYLYFYYIAVLPSPSSEAKSGEDLLLEESVLELLLAEDLSALLATANQIRHDLFCGAKRQILEDFEALRGNFRSHLV